MPHGAARWRRGQMLIGRWHASGRLQQQCMREMTRVGVAWRGCPRPRSVHGFWRVHGLGRLLCRFALGWNTKEPPCQAAGRCLSAQTSVVYEGGGSITEWPGRCWPQFVWASIISRTSGSNRPTSSSMSKESPPRSSFMPPKPPASALTADDD